MSEEIDKYLKIEGYEQISALMIGHTKDLYPRKEKFNLDELKLN